MYKFIVEVSDFYVQNCFWRIIYSFKNSFQKEIISICFKFLFFYICLVEEHIIDGFLSMYDC